ncbi:MAG: hypothetical protein JRN06_03305 [Nitrososphaerota archaeon]|nr:hypothetical protein [Nitrososphaerota archaeon]
MASGSSSCPCSSNTLFSFEAGSSPLPKGTYHVTATFDGEHHSKSSARGSFTVVDGSSGAVAAVSGAFFVIAVLASTRRVPHGSREGKSESGQRS